MFDKFFKNSIDVWKGKKSKWASPSCIIFALLTSFIISIMYYNYRNDKNSDKKPVMGSAILFFLVFTTINMLTRDAGITL
jgi:surface polysaccharide O-acyltransferase-like enzyme